MSASTFVRLMLSAAAAASAAAATSARIARLPDLGHPLAQLDELRADRHELGRRARGGEESVGDGGCPPPSLGLGGSGQRVGGQDLLDDADIGLGHAQCPFVELLGPAQHAVCDVVPEASRVGAEARATIMSSAAAWARFSAATAEPAGVGWRAARRPR